LHKLAEAFDRIFGRGFLFYDEFDFAAGDAASGVEPFGRPLGRADAVLPGAAAIPERGAKIPMRTGLFCAIAGATTSPDAANAPAAAADLSRLRRDRDMEFLPG